MIRIFSTLGLAAIVLFSSVNCAKVTSGPNHQIVRLGEKAQFSCVFEGDFTKDWRRWYLDNEQIWGEEPGEEFGEWNKPDDAMSIETTIHEGDHYQTITIEKVAERHLGTYACEVIFGQERREASLYAYDCKQDPDEALKMQQTGKMVCNVFSSDIPTELPTVAWEGQTPELPSTGRAEKTWTASSSLLGKMDTCTIAINGARQDSTCQVAYNIKVPVKVTELKVIPAVTADNVLSTTTNIAALECVVEPKEAKPKSFSWTVNKLPIEGANEAVYELPLEEGRFKDTKAFEVVCKANPPDGVTDIPPRDLTKSITFTRYETQSPDDEGSTGAASTTLPHLTLLAGLMALLRFIF